MNGELNDLIEKLQSENEALKGQLESKNDRVDYLEKALINSNKELDLARNFSKIGNWYWDVQTGNVEWSEQIYQIFQLNPNEFTPNINSILDFSPWPEDQTRDQELIQRAISSKEQGEFEQRYLRADGSIGYYYSTFQGIYSETGQLIGIYGSLKDITERIKLEIELKESEEKYRLISNVATDYMFSTKVNAAGNLESDWISGAFESISGYSLEEYNARGGWRSIVHPEDLNIDDYDISVLRENKKVVSEIRTIHKNGTTVWVQVFAHPVWDYVQNKLVGIYGAVKDITEKKEATELLKKSEERYRTIIENTNESIIVAQDKVLKYVNRKACELLELEQEEITSIPFTEFIYSEDQQMMFDRYNQRINGAKSSSTNNIFRVVAKGQQLKWVEIKTALFQWEGKPAILSFIVEITEHIALEKRRQEELLLLRTLINHLPSSIFVIDNKYRKTALNEAHLKRVENTLSLQHPIKEEDLLGKTNWDVYSKELADLYYEEDRKVIEEGLTIIERENYQIDQQGNPIWETISKIPMRDTDGLIIGMVGIAHNITKSKLSEIALQESEERFRKAIVHAPIPIAICSEDGTMIQISEGWTRYSGYSLEDISTISEWSKKGFPDRSDEMDQLIHGSFNIKETSRSGERKVVCKNGSTRIWDFYNTPIGKTSTGFRLLLTTANDITFRKKYERALKVSENKYKGIFSNTGTATIIIEDDGTISLVNSKFEELSGYQKEEIEGIKNLIEFVSQEDREQILKCHKNRLSENKDTLCKYEFSFIDRFNAVKSILLTVDMISGTKNSVASLLDISDRKFVENKLKASEEKFRLISNSAHDGIFMLNEENRLIYWNPAVEKIFEYPGEELVFININKLLVSPNQQPQKYLPINVSRRSNMLDKTGLSFDLEIERRNGEIIQIELSLAPLKISNHWGAVGIVRDITERKLFEKELIQAKEKAEESDRLKSAFLATMSHELRTPLNAVIGFSSLIDDTMEVPEIIEMVKIINDSGNHLLSLIDSVFSLALLQAGVSKVVCEDISLCNFMVSLKPFLKTKLSNEKKDKQIQAILTTHSSNNEIVIKSDRTKLTQMMINFFDNAIKYTKVGSIEYGCNIEGSSVTLFVKDSGIGIPEDKQTIIFEKFRQIDDSLTRINGGVGLGLSICKEIADLLEGKIWLKSEVGIGSTFYFKLDNVIELSQLDSAEN